MKRRVARISSRKERQWHGPGQSKVDSEFPCRHEERPRHVSGADTAGVADARALEAPAASGGPPVFGARMRSLWLHATGASESRCTQSEAAGPGPSSPLASLWGAAAASHAAGKCTSASELLAKGKS
jgi:hypothetical protein